jgi:hypothetical protein
MRQLERLVNDREVGYLVRGLKAIFAALAELHAQLNSFESVVEVLQHTVAKFRSAVCTFTDNSMPLCAYCMRFYDQVISWESCKQPKTAASTMDAEYQACGASTRRHYRCASC